MTTYQTANVLAIRITRVDPKDPSKLIQLLHRGEKKSINELYELTTAHFPELSHGILKDFVATLEYLGEDGWEYIKTLWFATPTTFSDRLQAICLNCGGVLPLECDDMDSCTTCNPVPDPWEVFVKENPLTEMVPTSFFRRLLGMR